MDRDRLLSAGQAAELLGMSASQFRRSKWREQIPHVQTPGGQWRAWSSDLLKFKNDIRSGSVIAAERDRSAGGFCGREECGRG